METPPKFPEWTEEERELIDLLFDRTIDDPAVKEKLSAWAESQRATSKNPNSDRAEAERDVRLSLIYQEAGLEEEAQKIHDDLVTKLGVHGYKDPYGVLNMLQRGEDPWESAVSVYQRF